MMRISKDGKRSAFLAAVAVFLLFPMMSINGCGETGWDESAGKVSVGNKSMDDRDGLLENPILKGFYPDPSICRVGDDFYLITSSFSMFPGVPIFHSTDLAHWEQIGYVLSRESQLHLTADSIIAGIMAPTLRYHDGTFYVITSNFSDRGNFIVTATDPRGPWSEPYWLPDGPGIDPSLFFDDDGRAYFTGTRQDTDTDGSSRQVIWTSEIDLKNMRLVGDGPTIWSGALKNAVYPEAPHIYKKDGYYYLVIAEGGTEHFHSVTIARSSQILGPYEGYAGNPVMTHRHLGKLYPICNVGHADLVELKNGDWYAVMLGSRLFGGYHKNLGRETFIAPVIWEDGWPVISPGTGKIEQYYSAPDLPEFTPAALPGRDDFEDDTLSMIWNFFGTPYQDFFSLRNSRLALKLMPRAMSPELERIDPSPESGLEKLDRNSKADMGKHFPSLGFIGRRQQHERFSVTANLEFHARETNETAGLVVMQANNHQFRLERSISKDRQVLRLVQCTAEFTGYAFQPRFTSKTTELALVQAEIDCDDIYLRIEAEGQDFSFYYGCNEHDMLSLYENADGRLINPGKVGGMVGTYVGMFASANGAESSNSASFDWFEYRGEDTWTPFR